MSTDIQACADTGACDPYADAIRFALDSADLEEALTAAHQQADSATASRDKAKAEADQHRQRADKLARDKEAAKKELVQARHQARQRVEKLEAALARKERERAGTEGNPGVHATIKSDDGSVMVQLAFNQVHIHEPERWYMVSSKPLDKAEKHRMIFCGLIDGIMAGEHADFIKGAMHSLAGKWRKENGCMRIEDSALAPRIVNQLEDAGYELLSEIDTEAKREALASVKGIGPATVQKVAAAAKKAAKK